jgi:ParB family chromosome partitioning protein
MSNIRKQLLGKETKLNSPKKASMGEHPASQFSQHPDGTLLHIDIYAINPDPNQPRKVFDNISLEELGESIKERGILQPVLVRLEGEKVWLVAGERRFRAAKLAGKEKIPAIITTGDPAEIALIENIQRENLKPLEEAEAFARLMETHGYKQEVLARVVGKARTTVTEILSINRLPEEIKDECRRADIPRRTLIEIVKKDTPEEMIALFAQVKSGEITGGNIRQITRQKKKRLVNTPLLNAIRMIKDLQKTIKKLNSAEMQDIEKQELWQEFNELHKLMQDLSA